MAADAQDADPLPDTFGEFAQPRWSDHALARWDERMPADAVAPETAYERSVPVHDSARLLLQTGDNKTADEVRLYGGHADEEAYCAVFVVMHRPSSTVVTCYRVASRFDYSVRAYCRARWQEVGR